jgi:hypothetical protein
MQLMMYIGNDHIESVSLDKEKISKPGYLGAFKRSLKVKYKDLISQHGSPADFMVIDNSPQTVNNQSANLYQVE